MKKFYLLLLLFYLHPLITFSQYVIQGTVIDKNNNETLIGATVVLTGTTIGTVTDINGKFELKVPHAPPFSISISFTGYVTQVIEIKSLSEKIKIQLATDEVLLESVEVTGQRISEKQKESPLTIEAMDIIAIKETPASNFYEGLGHLKGVDLVSASLGFKIINTRGFNSTSPVRSLQIIDGVDNQAPGLNFSLGNFLGASDLDVMKVDLVVGASSAFYGPNAFNGVINMTTKNPFLFPGLSVSYKVGERNLHEAAVRYAQVFKNNKGEEKFAYKFNLFYMQAYDWEANNQDSAFGTNEGRKNPGGYDAVNRYGDENLTSGQNNAFDPNGRVISPGLGRWHRTGYWEKDLVDYNSKNLRGGLAFHYKIQKDVELINSVHFGNGTTVYQGDNRYSLKDIWFVQNKVEIKKEDKYFLRFYATQEDAGNSYDAVFTAFLMQNAAKSNTDWSTDYRNYWNNNIKKKVQALPGFQKFKFGVPYPYVHNDSVMNAYHDSLLIWHEMARNFADTNPKVNSHAFYQPGTAEFDSLKKAITSRKSYKEGGTKFFDKSALYHVHGEYKFQPEFMDITTGGNFRLYRPNSEGTIFSDTTYVQYNLNKKTGDTVSTDTLFKRITNYEFGFYSGAEKKLWEEKIKLNLTVRMDKNQNFNYVFSPAFSVVFTGNQNHIFRGSLSSALRNPTLADQYLHYNVGRAILLGNITGYDSLVTLPSLNNFINTQNPDTLHYVSLDPIKPERVKTVEFGYRATLLKRVFLDAGYYYSFYNDFIGYMLLADVKVDTVYNRPTSVQPYRIATNARDMVTTQGASIGLNYFFGKYYALSGNYSWNVLNIDGVNDTLNLIPAFNTPPHKYNVGLSGRDMLVNFGLFKLRNFGFNFNYKYVKGFMYEGSPQFTGYVPTYDMFDGQINYHIPVIKSTFKLGVSNLFGYRKFENTTDESGSTLDVNQRFKNAFRNENLQVYGGPYVGRMIYFSVLFEPGK